MHRIICYTLLLFYDFPMRSTRFFTVSKGVNEIANKLLNIEPNNKVADFHCGNGAFITEAVDLICHVVIVAKVKLN